MSSHATPPEEPQTLGAKSLLWGVMTWVLNFIGCLISMVPIALPLGVILTVLTFFSGIWAMLLGLRGWREPPDPNDEHAIHQSRWGFWLGAAHVVTVVALALTLLVAWQAGMLDEVIY